MKTTPEIVETLFYNLQNNILLSDKTKSKLYLDILRFEYKNNQENFKLDDIQMNSLSEYGYIVDNELFTNKIDIIADNSTELSFSHDNVIEKESDLKNLLINEFRLLADVLKIDLKLLCSEKQVTYGKIDLVAKTNDTIFPIELKRNTAKHDVIGQINKYMIYYKLRLNYKLWKYVKGIVIASDFEEFTLKELRSQGIYCIQYFKTDKLSLRLL